MNLALWKVRMVSSWATPGATILRPPDQPAMKCGSTSPVANPELRLDEPPVELHRCAASRGDPEVDVGRGVAREVILDPHRVEHPPVTDELRELLALVGPVESGCDEDGHVFARDPGIQQAANQGSEKQAIRHRSGDVAHENARGVPAPRQLARRRRADGLGERPVDSPRRIVDGRHRVLAHHRDFAALGHAHRKPSAAVFELHDHRCSPRKMSAGVPARILADSRLRTGI